MAAELPEAVVGPQGEGPEGERVADSLALPEGGRLHFCLQGRYVTVLRLKGKLSCIDSICFHAGGPLGLGDIEEVDGKSCILCPWHYYKIDCNTGDKYYQTVSWDEGRMVPGEWKSNGVKQRCHMVVEKDGGIYVHVAEEKPSIESDGYAFDIGCGERVMKGGKSDANRRGNLTGGDGVRKPSGVSFLQAWPKSMERGSSSLSGVAKPNPPPAADPTHGLDPAADA